MLVLPKTELATISHRLEMRPLTSERVFALRERVTFAGFPIGVMLPSILKARGARRVVPHPTPGARLRRFVLIQRCKFVVPLTVLISNGGGLRYNGGMRVEEFEDTQEAALEERLFGKPSGPNHTFESAAGEPTGRPSAGEGGELPLSAYTEDDNDWRVRYIASIGVGLDRNCVFRQDLIRDISEGMRVGVVVQRYGNSLDNTVATARNFE